VTPHLLPCFRALEYRHAESQAVRPGSRCTPARQWYRTYTVALVGHASSVLTSMGQQNRLRRGLVTERSLATDIYKNLEPGFTE